MHTRTLAIVAFLQTACFQPSDGSVPIRCDSENTCPAGQVCLAGICGGQATPDLAVADLSPIASVGCAGTNGVKIADKMWGCPGAFGMGQARSLCARGWTACTSLSDTDRPSCHSQIPLFVADIPAFRPGTSPVVCAPTATDQRLLAACASTLHVEYASGCNGFYRFAIDKYAGFDFSNGHSLDKAISNNPANGVLCCL